jgi:PAS domain S-box-containing protein
MNHWLRERIFPPQFGIEAQWLHGTLLCLLFGVVVSCMLFILAQEWTSLLITLVIGLGLLGLLALVRLGHVRYAGILLTLLLLVAGTAGACLSGGIEAGIVSIYFLILALGALVLDANAVLLLALLSILALWGLFFVQLESDTLIHSLHFSTGRVLLTSLILAATAIALRFALQRFQNALDHAHRNEQALADNVHQFEQEVAERKQAEVELQQRTAQLEALQQLSLNLTAQLDLETLLQSIVSQAIKLLGGTAGGLYLYQPERDLLEWHIGIGPGLPPIGNTLRRGEGLSGKVWETGQPLIVNDYQSWYGRSAAFDDLPNAAAVGVVVQWGDQLLGILTIVADVPHTFTPADADLLSMFATQAATAIRNAQLFEEASRRAERLAVVNRIAHAVGMTLDLDELLETVYYELTAIFEPDALFVALYDQEANELDFRLQVDEGVRQEPARQLLTEGLTSIVVGEVRPLLIRDFEQEYATLPAPTLWGTMKLPASWLGVPMLTGGRVVGVVSVQAYRSYAYDEQDQALFSTIAEQIAMAVERARLVQGLRTSEEYYRTLFEQASDAVFLETLDGRIVDANEHACRLLGYEYKELLSLSVADLVPPEVREILSKIVEQILRAGGIRLETENLRRNGTRVPVEVNTTVMEVGGEHLVLALVRDISERRRAERFLKSLNQAALEMARTAAPDEVFAAVARAFQDLGMFCMVFLLNKDQTRLSLRYLSHKAKIVEAAQNLVHLRADEFTIAIDDLELARKVIYERQAILSENAREMIAQVLPANAQRYAALLVQMFQVRRMAAAPLEIEGRVLGVLTVQADDLRPDDLPAINAFAHQLAAAWRKAQLMHDLERSLEELQRTQHQLLQAQKMEAVGRLAGGLAHDFSNMLTIVHFSAQLMKRQLHADDPLWEHLRQIQEASDRAGTLTKQLLSFSRREIIEPQILNLSEAVEDLSHMLRRIIGEDIELLTSLAPDLWPVKADPARIEQAIVNLVVNARDAMPNGGRLSIETANTNLDRAYAAQHLEVEPGEYVRLVISDTGIGMTEEVQAHLFEPFFTTKEPGKGTGLGLATVFGIIKHHEGHIWVYSEVGQGTVFKIYLPRAKDKASPETAVTLPPLEASPPPKGNETILIVEDNPRVRELCVRILQMHGYEVLSAGEGSEALQISDAHQGPIHLLLTDVVMPEMNGKELANRLQARRPRLRVLYMSGYDDNVIAHHGVLDEGTAFLAKPFSVDTLAQRVRTVLDSDSPATG